MFTLRDLTPTFTTIARTPNQPLITNRTPSNEANRPAARFRTDQQNEQHKNYRHGRPRQKFLPQPTSLFRDPSVTNPIRHDQDICREENGPNRPQHNDFSNCQTHHLPFPIK